MRQAPAGRRNVSMPPVSVARSGADACGGRCSGGSALLHHRLISCVPPGLCKILGQASRRHAGVRRANRELTVFGDEKVPFPESRRLGGEAVKRPRRLRGCARRLRGCARRLRGCARRLRGCARRLRGCARRLRGCARRLRGCARRLRGCARRLRGCARRLRGCPRRLRGCPRRLRGCQLRLCRHQLRSGMLILALFCHLQGVPAVFWLFRTVCQGVRQAARGFLILLLLLILIFSRLPWSKSKSKIKIESRDVIAPSSRKHTCWPSASCSRGRALGSAASRTPSHTC